ncbi:hypothetical protein QYH69_12110 [Paraburkholderia sp. SARCC-3016]|nr:hypothetical protein [Paraburkholderia sp. SARCC-3016]
MVGSVLAAGLFASRQSALLGAWIAGVLAWPVIHPRGCWDIEHCRVTLWGYALILLSLFGPALLWAYVGFQQGGQRSGRKFVLTLVTLWITTVMFYLFLYALV